MLLMQAYPRVSTFKAASQLREHLAGLHADLPCDDELLLAEKSPLGASLRLNSHVIGNRWAIHPMEGWDGSHDGLPSEHTIRRWRHFGASGAKLIWGGEAVAVCPEGRANPNQLMLQDHTLSALEGLLRELRQTHRNSTGADEDLFVGLQLTHSGRFCRPEPDNKPHPFIAYRHPILDRRLNLPGDYPLVSDAYLDDLVEKFVLAAKQAERLGFQFVDVKHCHGYLAHELLGAHTRDGQYGGSFDNRTRFLREVTKGIRAECPNLEIGVRVSIFDSIPYRPDPAETTESQMGPGIPEPFEGDYLYGFGVDPKSPTQADFTEGFKFIQLLLGLGIRLVNITAGSPYYAPHIQRPALFPPSDGYSPPEDPLLGVHRLLNAARLVKQQYPEAILTGTGFTYLQEYLPHVAQAVIREGWMDFAGIGRMVLSYPELPLDVLRKAAIDRRKLCRTFSDCTTGPRKGLISGCYPLDAHYKNSTQGELLRSLKARK